MLSLERLVRHVIYNRPGNSILKTNEAWVEGERSENFVYFRKSRDHKAGGVVLKVA